ncbi:unnamed protein product, partial [Laminaria digitata]
YRRTHTGIHYTEATKPTMIWVSEIHISRPATIPQPDSCCIYTMGIHESMIHKTPSLLLSESTSSGASSSGLSHADGGGSGDDTCPGEVIATTDDDACRP